MIFRKKSAEQPTLETKSDSKLSGFQSISSIFKGNSEESVTESVPETIPETEFFPELEIPKPSSNKSVRLIQKVQKLKDRTIIPFVDYNKGQLLYPILSKIPSETNPSR